MIPRIYNLLQKYFFMKAPPFLANNCHPPHRGFIKKGKFIPVLNYIIMHYAKKS
jgi:hypothetical protein